MACGEPYVCFLLKLCSPYRDTRSTPSPPVRLAEGPLVCRYSLSLYVYLEMSISGELLLRRKRIHPHMTAQVHTHKHTHSQASLTHTLIHQYILHWHILIHTHTPSYPCTRPGIHRHMHSAMDAFNHSLPRPSTLIDSPGARQ